MTDVAASCDTWSYDTGSNAWKALGLIDGPSGRLYHYSIVYAPAVDKVLLSGGRATRSREVPRSTTVWSFDTATSTWTVVSPTGERPMEADREPRWCSTRGAAGSSCSVV